MYCQVTRFEWLTDFQEKKQEISEGRAVQCARYFAQNQLKMWSLRNQHQTKTVVVKLARNMRYKAMPKGKKVKCN